MQQPYQTNPACHYKVVPLEKEEQTRLWVRTAMVLIPLALISGWLVYYRFSKGPETILDVLQLFAFAIIFVLSIYHLFKKENEKEIFESEFVRQYGVIFLNKIELKDAIAWMSPLPFYKVSRMKHGKRYRIHKLSGRSLILKIEDVS